MACTLAVKGSSLFGNRESPNTENPITGNPPNKMSESEFLKACTAVLKEYDIAVYLRCSPAASPLPNAFPKLNALIRSESFTGRMFCQEIKSNFGGRCKGVEGCSPKTVCSKSVDWEKIPSLGPPIQNVDKTGGFKITEDKYNEVKNRKKRKLLPFTQYERYYELHFGTKSKRIELPDYYFTIECEDCWAGKNCVVQDLDVDYYKNGYLPELGTGQLTFIIPRNYSYNLCTIAYYVTESSFINPKISKLFSFLF